MQDMLVLIGAEAPSGQAIAKKLRAEQFACRLLPSSATADEVRALDMAGIVIAAEEAEGAAPPDVALLGLGIPVLALGSAARALLGGLAERCDGGIAQAVVPVYYRESPILRGMEDGERWIERADCFEIAAPFSVIAEADGLPVAVANESENQYFIQFQIERNDLDGAGILRTFAGAVCGCGQWWTTEKISEDAEALIRAEAGGEEAICAMSGGLDSTVAALLSRRALGDKVRCVFVDTGLLREGEAEESERYFEGELGLNFTRVDASGRILQALKGLSDMSSKWRVIEREITAALAAQAEAVGARVFIKGTNYSDRLAGSSVKAEGGGKIIAPLIELFKGEIRQLGQELGVSDAVLGRQPFPGMGLAARIHGEVTEERIHTLRRADHIFVEEITLAGQEKRLSRCFALLDITGTGACVVVLRALHGMEPAMGVARLPYDLLERTVERIHRELPQVDRVLYDMTPGRAEW